MSNVGEVRLGAHLISERVLHVVVLTLSHVLVSMSWLGLSSALAPDVLARLRVLRLGSGLDPEVLGHFSLVIGGQVRLFEELSLGTSYSLNWSGD